MQPDDAAHLWDMREAARRLSRLNAEVDRSRFDRDEMVQLSVERLLQNIGEAARRVSTEFRSAHPEIPWAQIIAQRNVLVHEYGEVRPELVWLTAVRDVPELLRHLEPLVPEEPED
jgi:uncharacterized protein with HEPN domain